jgi:signal transduction histidine kinase
MSGVTTDSAREPGRQTNHPQDWLAGGGKMGEHILSMDWSGSPLGAIEFWPQSLCTTVSLCLASSFPISVAWGPEHTLIYNDGYWPICGEKHPQAMGQNFTECWASAWPVIGEAFARAHAGETSFLENQRMFLDRNGYLEETFFTFSFSPIRDEHGVAGLFHPVIETTARMLGERRTRALSDLAARTGKSQTVEEACALAVETLADHRLDVPFVLLYLFDGQSVARLVASAGLSRESPAHAVQIDLSGNAAATWPLSALHSSGLTQHATNLEGRFGHLACNDYSESVKEALVLPILPPGCERPIGAVIAGVSSRLPLNEAYRAFYDLLAAAVTREIANARAYEEESRRAEALAELDRAKTHFFANVSHEFRTPLTLMLGPLEEELAEQRDPLPPLRHERLATAHRNSLRLLKLVNHLLDFSRIEAGRVQASYVPTDLATYTAELASVFRAAIEKAELRLNLECAPLSEPVFVDRDMWEKIVLNLLSNALKHTFAGSITVGLKECDEHIELSVADTGVGIAAGDLPHLFERFRRVQEARSRTYEGTGIGLALVRELAQLHGGGVAVTSQENVGSTFTVTIKRGPAHLPPDHVASGPAREASSMQKAVYVEEGLSWIANPTHPVEVAVAASGAPAGPAKSRPKILLADDNADMRGYVGRLLAGHYDVDAVADGVQALTRAREATPDLVLTDIMMPGLDGFGLLRALRAQASTRGVPVIFLSARAGQEQAVEGLQAGADDYLAKPFSAEELLARVHTHLEQARIRRIWVSELEQSNKELETFSYSVSHDLRAPLRAMDGFSKLLLDEYAGQLDEQGCRYLARIRTGTQNMSVIINSLLGLSRVSRGVLRKQEINLSEMAQRILSGLQHRDPSRSVLVTIASGLVAEADRRLIMMALRNLLENAWQFTAVRSPAEIHVGQEDQAGEQVFFIRDNGGGFDSQYADQLFKPFQGVRPAEEFSGGGIGLAMVHRAITRHGGRIWAKTARDAGATFYFTLGGLG